jgi:hypothetical protein
MTENPTFTTKAHDQHTRVEIVDPEELDGHDAYLVATCDTDGTPVSFINVGTSEDAECRNGHHWQDSFDGAVGWIYRGKWK